MSWWLAILLISKVFLPTRALAEADYAEQLVRRCLHATLEHGTLFEPVWGTDPQDDVRFPGSKILYIHKGNCARVYRVVSTPESGNRVSFPLKLYSDYRKGWNIDTGWEVQTPAAKLRQPDYEALLFFRQLQEEGVDLGFDIPEVSLVDLAAREDKPKEDAIVGLKYDVDILGRDVMSILEDKSLPQTLRDRVGQTYEQKLAVFERAFQKHMAGTRSAEIEQGLRETGNPKVNFPYLGGYYTRTLPGITLYGARLSLGANQIVVDARDFKFYLVDTE